MVISPQMLFGCVFFTTFARRFYGLWQQLGQIFVLSFIRQDKPKISTQ